MGMQLGARPPNCSFIKLLQVSGGVGRVESEGWIGIIQGPVDIVLK